MENNVTLFGVDLRVSANVPNFQVADASTSLRLSAAMITHSLLHASGSEEYGALIFGVSGNDDSGKRRQRRRLH
jgi:hypothetical protein